MKREIWVTHETVYDFDRPVDGVTVRARLRPVDDDAQTVLEHDLLCHPRPRTRDRTVDVNGAPVERLLIAGPLRRIEVRGQSRLSWSPDAPLTRPWPQPERQPVPAPSWSRPGGAIWSWARNALPDAAPSRADVHRFMDLIGSSFTFDASSPDLVTPIPAFFRRRRGVCQDYARLAAGCLQARGAEVRLVMGYLVRSATGESRFETGQPHAWLSVWDPRDGWIDSDPTTGIVPPSHHLTLRRGRRLRDLQPVSGALVASPDAMQRLNVRVTIVHTQSMP